MLQESRRMSSSAYAVGKVTTWTKFGRKDGWRQAKQYVGFRDLLLRACAWRAECVKKRKVGGDWQ